MSEIFLSVSAEWCCEHKHGCHTRRHLASVAAACDGVLGPHDRCVMQDISNTLSVIFSFFFLIMFYLCLCLCLCVCVSLS